jgi:hypothetical protein
MVDGDFSSSVLPGDHAYLTRPEVQRATLRELAERL